MATFNEESFEKLVLQEQTRRELALREEIEPQVSELFEDCIQKIEEFMSSLAQARENGANLDEFFEEYLQVGVCQCNKKVCTFSVEGIKDGLNDILDLIEEYLLF